MTLPVLLTNEFPFRLLDVSSNPYNQHFIFIFGIFAGIKKETLIALGDLFCSLSSLATAEGGGGGVRVSVQSIYPVNQRVNKWSAQFVFIVCADLSLTPPPCVCLSFAYFNKSHDSKPKKSIVFHIARMCIVEERERTHTAWLHTICREWPATGWKQAATEAASVVWLLCCLRGSRVMDST